MESNEMLEVFNVTEDIYNKSVLRAIEIIRPHVTDSYIYVSHIVKDMKRCMGGVSLNVEDTNKCMNELSYEEKILISYGVGGIVSSIMEKTDQGFLTTDILNSIIRESKED